MDLILNALILGIGLHTIQMLLTFTYKLDNAYFYLETVLMKLTISVTNLHLSHWLTAWCHLFPIKYEENKM